MKSLFMISLLSLSVCGLTAQTVDTVNLANYFGDYRGTFVLYDMNNNKIYKHNPQRAHEQFTPASTFKIPNSLIGLETGVIPDDKYVIPWDSVKREFDSWNRDHDLRSAMKFSVVPYYQELARRVGEVSMKEFINKFNYGNMDVSGGIDMFWLRGGLFISADEQITFLKKFYENILQISERSINIVKDILIKEKTDKFTFSAKTGTGMTFEGEIKKYIAWYVGYVEQNNNVYFFAMNFDAYDFNSVYNDRLDITRKVLNRFGLML
ncbi:MAG: class D beta-lactamase [bacterium]